MNMGTDTLHFTYACHFLLFTSSTKHTCFNSFLVSNYKAIIYSIIKTSALFNFVKCIYKVVRIPIPAVFENTVLDLSKLVVHKIWINGL